MAGSKPDKYTPTRYARGLPGNVPAEPDDEGDDDVADILAATPDNYLECQGGNHNWPRLFEAGKGLIWQRVLATWPNGSVRIGAKDMACRSCGLVRTTLYVFYPGRKPRRIGGHSYDYKTAPGYLFTKDPDAGDDVRPPTRAERESELMRRFWEERATRPKGRHGPRALGKSRSA